MPNPSQAQPWYVSAFRRDYLERYAHRSQEAAAREVPFLSSMLGLDAGTRVLDLCCGAGRYGAGLAERGVPVIGVDLSWDMLKQARVEHPAFQAARADMRVLPFKGGMFHGVLNLFTSFGYFESDSENLAALQETVRVLKAGGHLVLDFFNLQTTLEGLQQCTQKDCDGGRIVETRCYDQKRKRLEKTIRIEGASDLSSQEIRESVRAYSPEDLEALFRQAGLELHARFGDLQGGAFDPGNSLRCVSVGKKP